MSCPDCRDAAKLGQGWGGYRAGCHGCSVRALSRSGAMWTAMKRNRSNELREAAARLWPGQDFDAIRADLLRWWNTDHPEAT